MTPQNGTYELLAQKEQEALETQGVLSDADESEVPFLRRTEKKRRNRKDLYLIVSSTLNLLFLIVCIVMIADIYQRPKTTNSGGDGLTPYGIPPQPSLTI